MHYANRFLHGNKCLYFQIEDYSRIHFVIDRNFKAYVKLRKNKPDLIYNCSTEDEAVDKMQTFIKEHPNFEKPKTSVQVKREFAKHEPIYVQQELFT